MLVAFYEGKIIKVQNLLLFTYFWVRFYEQKGYCIFLYAKISKSCKIINVCKIYDIKLLLLFSLNKIIKEIYRFDLKKSGLVVALLNFPVNSILS